MDRQWFWQTDGEQYGPLSTEELEDLIIRNRIQDGDKIRLDNSDDWLPACQVKAMFALPAESASPGSTALAAAQLLARIERQQLENEPEETSWAARATVLFGKGLCGPASILGTIVSWTANLLAVSMNVMSRKVVLGIIVILLLAVLFRNTKFGDTQTQAAHADMAEAFDQLQLMKKRGASKAEWQEFERETLQWLTPLRRELGEAATRNAFGYDFWPISQFSTANAQRNLVVAGWALSESIYAEAHKPASEIDNSLEVVFSTRMNLAQGFWNREITDTTTAVQTQIGSSSDDPLITGIVIVDVGVVGGGLAFWIRKRRRNVPS